LEQDAFGELKMLLGESQELSMQPLDIWGGDFSDPSYKDVCNNKTGHAEVVQVKYNSLKITYYKLLESFWRMHDPTQVGRQGQDIGNQYRSVIFYHTLEQKSIFEKSKRELENSGKVKNKISTAIIPATRFWRAEEYHQRYIEKSGKVGCHT